MIGQTLNYGAGEVHPGTWARYAVVYIATFIMAIMRALALCIDQSNDNNIH